MAQLIGDIQITGSLQNLSFYKMRGSDKIIVRKKGGPTRKQVKHSPKFENTRRNNKEFGGRAIAAMYIKSALHHLMYLADYNITGPLNALLKPIQKLDTVSEWGKRSIMLSKNPRLLEGFTLNRRYLFESIVRTPVSYSIQDQQAIIDIPGLLPGINFMAPGNYPCYQLIAVAGLVPDVFYKDDRFGYLPLNDRYRTNQAFTDWLPVNKTTAATTLTVSGLPVSKPDDCSIIVAVGIAFGNMQGTEIQPVKYVGGAKVIGVE